MDYGVVASFRKFSAHRSPRKIVYSQAVSITRLSEKRENLTCVKYANLCKGNTCAEKAKTASTVTTTLSALYLLQADYAQFSVWLHNKTCLGSLITSIFLRLSFKENYCPETSIMARCIFLHLRDTMKIFYMCITYLRWGWVFLERTRILSGIQFTTHCIEIFVVETKRFGGSFVNVILTRQTCGQRLSRTAESKRRALGNYFFERICYMFLISKCRGDRDLGLCTTSGLTIGEPRRNGDSPKKNVFRRSKNRILSLRCGSPNASPEVVHRPRSESPLHFDIRNI